MGHGICPFISMYQSNSLCMDYSSKFVRYNDVVHIEGLVSGPRSQTLTLTYTPQAHDGCAYWAASS